MRIHPLVAGAAASVIVLSRRRAGISARSSARPAARVAGHQIERHARTTKHYEVQVRMPDGKLKTVKFAARPAWKSGDKVRLQDGKLVSA